LWAKATTRLKDAFGMSRRIAQIQKLCAPLPAEVIERHLARLPRELRDRFSDRQIAQQLQCITRLDNANPVEVMLEPTDDGQVACTVIAFDHPFEFSLITGSLAGAGFNIEAGWVHTLPPAPRDAPAAGRSGVLPRFLQRLPRRSTAARQRDPHDVPIILDVFFGRPDADLADLPRDQWFQRVRDGIVEVITLLDKADDASVQKAKKLVNERVTARLANMASAAQPRLFPVELDIRRLENQRIRLTLTAQDTPAFLYALSTALSLRGLSIDHVQITPEADGDRITDLIDLIPPPSTIEVDESLLQRIKLSALLTKQFTYFLDRSPDPFAALSRFERLADDILSKATDADSAEDWLKLMADPRAMRDLAKVLGTSDYLWEDFIRGQYETLEPLLRSGAAAPIFAEPPETLPYRIEQALEGAVGLAEQQDRLNRFKDREIFQLDLDQILNPAMGFRQFSERLTFLAETLVAAAARLVYDDLVRSYGKPSTRDSGDTGQDNAAPGSLLYSGSDLPYAVFGLGKLGGVAIGYASDIELLFVFDADPTARTAGGKRQPVSNHEFFEQFVEETSRFIRTRQAGIFEMDLRLRPYGKEGPLAVSADQFNAYYGPGGPAHTFEKLALVRLRWIAGNPELGYRIEQARDAIVYDHADQVLDLDALWTIWNKVKQQKLEGTARRNAKYSPGALVDLEGTVQLLQVKHARRAPQLRVPRLSLALEALQRAAVLRPAQYAHLRAAYEFLRQLINALRMLRGNAQDLFLPEPDSLELLHLARRMGYVGRAAASGASASTGSNTGSSTGSSAASTSADVPDDSGPAQRLLKDFATHTTHVRTFIREHFGRPCPGEAGEQADQ
jgi:[glutamine synthetase] adenylyltransferase / [glutamine synthetase]-adenylyl-L-tyrosine phosphorylase